MEDESIISKVIFRTMFIILIKFFFK